MLLRCVRTHVESDLCHLHGHIQIGIIVFRVALRAIFQILFRLEARLIGSWQGGVRETCYPRTANKVPQANAAVVFWRVDLLLQVVSVHQQEFAIERSPYMR